EFGCREKCARLIHRICRRPGGRLRPSCWREARGCGGQDNCGGKAAAFLSAYPSFLKRENVCSVHDLIFFLLFLPSLAPRFRAVSSSPSLRYYGQVGARLRGKVGKTADYADADEGDGNRRNLLCAD